jgi:hypothetical protein
MFWPFVLSKRGKSSLWEFRIDEEEVVVDEE